MKSLIGKLKGWFVSEVPEPPSGGPDGHLNWRCADLGLEEDGAVEFALYSDARLVEHAAFGPYEVINTVPTDQHDRMPMVAVLRMRWHIPERDPLPDMSKSATRRRSTAVESVTRWPLSCRSH